VTDTTITPAKPQILPPGQKSLPELVEEIRQAHEKVMIGLAHSAAEGIRAGKSLNQLKAQLRKEHGHGNWQEYVILECRLAPRTAQVYMYLARQEDKLKQLLAGKANGNAAISQSQALKLLSAARTKRRPRRKKAEG
jgi:hypothetical protein